MVNQIVKGMTATAQKEWAAKQVYIALGQLMGSVAALGIDACPLEGINPVKYDALLGLEGSGFTTVVACAVGYRSDSDKTATMKKIRFPAARLIKHV
jgi:nitroreductase